MPGSASLPGCLVKLAHCRFSCAAAVRTGTARRIRRRSGTSSGQHRGAPSQVGAPFPRRTASMHERKHMQPPVVSSQLPKRLLRALGRSRRQNDGRRPSGLLRGCPPESTAPARGLFLCAGATRTRRSPVERSERRRGVIARCSRPKSTRSTSPSWSTSARADSAVRLTLLAPGPWNQPLLPMKNQSKPSTGVLVGVELELAQRHQGSALAGCGSGPAARRGSARCVPRWRSISSRRDPQADVVLRRTAERIARVEQAVRSASSDTHSEDVRISFSVPMPCTIPSPSEPMSWSRKSE